MTETTHAARLNDLLIDLSRSLLQYAQEAWPWTSVFDTSNVREGVNRLALDQRASVQMLASYLDAAGHPIDFGVYPDEYTSLHYVSLGYLVRQLIVNTQALVEECDQAAREMAGDEDAVALATDIGQHERAALAELQSLNVR